MQLNSFLVSAFIFTWCLNLNGCHYNYFWYILKYHYCWKLLICIPKLVNDLEKVKMKHTIVAIGCIFLQEVWKLLLKCNAVKQSTSKFLPKHQRTNKFELSPLLSTITSQLWNLDLTIYCSAIGWKKCKMLKFCCTSVLW